MKFNKEKKRDSVLIAAPFCYFFQKAGNLPYYFRTVSARALNWDIIPKRFNIRPYLFSFVMLQSNRGISHESFRGLSGNGYYTDIRYPHTGPVNAFRRKSSSAQTAATSKHIKTFL